MRIGVITLPLNTNYGGILQAYALQTVLKRMGHEVILLDKFSDRRKKALWIRPLTYTNRIIRKLIFKQKIRIFAEEYHNRTYRIIAKDALIFINNHINRINVQNISQLKESDFDELIVGSDQIWRPKYYGKIEEAYLDFARNWKIKKVVYGASFGTDRWEYNDQQTINCLSLIKLFDAVSVREESGVELCREKFNIHAERVLDPTMLLSKEDYIALIENAGTPKSKGNLLVYFLDETQEKNDLITIIANEKGLSPFNFSSKAEDEFSPINERIQQPLETWLRGFYDAEFVITDSFHGCIFSIIFNKPFIVYGNITRGMTRFHSLLKIFGLENRMITSIKDYKTINYNNVNSETILLEERKKSMDYLKRNL